MTDLILAVNSATLLFLLGLSLYNMRKVARLESRMQLLYDNLSVKFKFKE